MGNLEVQAITTAHTEYKAKKTASDSAEFKTKLEDAVKAIDTIEYDALPDTDKAIVDEAKNALKEIDETKNNTNNELADAKNLTIGDFKSFESADGKTRTKEYITDIQKFILATWASNIPADKKDQNNNGTDDRLEDGKIGKVTRAGVMTIEKKLMEDPYNLTEDQLGITTGAPSWFPGPKFLAALKEAVDGKARYQKIIDDAKANTSNFFSKIYTTADVVQYDEEKRKIPPTEKKKEENASATEANWDKAPEAKENKVLTEKKAKILENLKKIPWLENITTIDGLWITFDKDTKASLPTWLWRTYPQNTNNLEISLFPWYKIEWWKVIKSIEKEISNNYVEIIQKDIKDDLWEYLKKNLTFSDKKYQDYYDNQTKWKNIVCNKTWSNIEILWSTVTDSYRISVDPKNIFNVKDTLTDFNSITNMIKQDIISKVDAQEKLKRENKLLEKHNTLKDYLLWIWNYKVFSKEYLYPDFKNLEKWQQNKINAFFMDFKNLIGDNGLSFEYDLNKNSKNKKQILLTVDEDGRNTKYWNILLDIEKNINPDGTVNKEQIRKDLRNIIDNNLLTKA